MTSTFFNIHALVGLLLERLGGLNIMGLNTVAYLEGFGSLIKRDSAGEQNKTVLQLPIPPNV